MTETPNTETAGGAWTRRETLAATVHFTHPDTGEEIGPIYLPYEEGNPPSEEEVYAQAWEYYSRIEHIRGGLKEKTIEAVATELRTGGIGKWMARELRTMLRDGVKVAAKPGDGATPEEIAEDEATAAEMNALLHDKGDELTGALLEESPRWREFAEDALSQSWAQALGDFLEEHPDAGDWPDDRFDSAVRARYQEGDYFTGATLNTGRTWIEIIARDIAAGFEEGDGKPGPIASGIEEKARARVRKRMPRPEIPIERAIFGEDGYALIPSDVVSNGLRRATLGGPRFWAPLPDTGRPEGRHDIGLKKAREAQGRIFFGISEATYPTPEDAFSIVRGLGLAHWDVFSYVMARWLEEGNRGPYGGVYVSAERFLDSRGLARHKRAHRPEYVSAFYHDLYALEAVTVAGNVPHHKKGQAPVLVDTDLLNITQRVRQKQLDGTDKLLGCYVRPGDWSADLQDMAPQVALTLRSVFQLDNKRQRPTKLISLYLIEQFRIAAGGKGAARTFRIATILEGACIEIGETERKNPARFRRQIEDAIEDLEMLEPALLTRWRYLDTVPTKGRGMLDQWLASRVSLTPAPAFHEQYRPVSETREARLTRRKPKALKG
jgi:hypothetical protein